MVPEITMLELGASIKGGRGREGGGVREDPMDISGAKTYDFGVGACTRNGFARITASCAHRRQGRCLKPQPLSFVLFLCSVSAQHDWLVPIFYKMRPNYSQLWDELPLKQLHINGQGSCHQLLWPLGKIIDNSKCLLPQLPTRLFTTNKNAFYQRQYLLVFRQI